MIIDCHMHILPFLGGASGWGSKKAHLDYLQRFMYGAAHPEETIKHGYWTKDFPDIKFQVGANGRMEWTESGQNFYRQFMPPSLQKQISPPEFILAQMDHAGVDMSVLQNCNLYGKLNSYFAEAVTKYPDRFVGTGEINAFRADKPAEIEKLRWVVKELKFRGIYYEATRFLEFNEPAGFNNKKYDRFWKEVSDLGIAVLWGFTASKLHIQQMRALGVLADKYPEIPVLVSMGFCVRPYLDNGKVIYPKELFDIYLKRPNLHAELVYPIQAGPLGWDYPYPAANELIKKQYEVLGPKKLVWGSDMPNVERNCTYTQSLTHLTKHCDFIKPKDMDLILSENIIRIMKIYTNVPKTPRAKLAGVA